jgi:tetratricopeptide (TPR) repeat protein
VAAWAALIEQVLKEAQVPADADGQKLTPAALARLAEVFPRAYRDRFQAEPPRATADFDRTRREIQGLRWPRAARPGLALVLGALEGEYLRQSHCAAWHLSPGPLAPEPPPTAQPEEESPFGYVVNPFLWPGWRGTADAPDGADASAAMPLEALLASALGRPLVLANDPAVGRAAVAALTDPDLARGADLFRQKKGDEAERVLRDLLKQKRHERNSYLALEVGKLLYDNGRKESLRRLLEAECEKDPPEARKFNLLGLAQLDADPRQAIESFKSALRCDLRFGPAYLNLAQAYQANNEPRSARQCLIRYLELLPDGPYAADARRRLAAFVSAGP